jgi:hypothetical protein
LHGIEPEFCRNIIAIDVNMRPLVRLMTVEVESVRAGAEHRRRGAIVAKAALLAISTSSLFIQPLLAPRNIKY